MRVLILHDPVGEGARPDELDTLVQVDAVAEGLAQLGHDVRRLAFEGDSDHDAAAVRAARPDVVFNLVESVSGQGRLIHLAPALLERLGLSFTGASSQALYQSSGKVAAKRVLASRGIPTPAWATRAQLASGVAVAAGRWVVKSIWEHGSLGLEPEGVVRADDARELLAVLDERWSALGGGAFAELYVHGREVNVALLAGPDGPQVLPIPEIVFEGLEDDAPRIVGYRAKWDPDSFDYGATPRAFLDEAREPRLASELARHARATWDAFGLGGAARVDFRVDDEGRPWVIDVNANPCLSPDAGFAATLAAAGLAYEDALARLLEDALARPACAPLDRHVPHPTGRQ